MSPALWPSASLRPSDLAMVGTTSPGSLKGAKATKATPSGKDVSASRAASRARLVLPTPPMPVSVTSLISERSTSSSRISASSFSRPKSGVGAFDRVVLSVRPGLPPLATVLPRPGTAARRAARSSSESSKASARDLTVCG
jgi:hypothetical protein